MDMDWIWKSALLVIAGMVLLRISGRKSISQMSVATTVIMISIGTTIVQPIANDHLWKAIGSAAVFIVSLIIIEYLQLKYDWIERALSGRSKVIIENGQLNINTLRSVRMSVDQVEMMLRQQGVSNIKDVKTATLEPNGQIGYELMRHAKPITIGELERILGLESKGNMDSGDLFQEVINNDHVSSIDPTLQ
ncbi:DUF421 domain-containing protein [Paenibacillus sp. 19GGS1-52]|uniref:DUF421 domain-containing protein n=1 Tax=Paenibacillus sp. 19GGS1-52 TaxID=2758563 RepID=UPI001EFAAF49|nr:DUF421 domain-containing protein [Paenibacillus sp. 19GGS1-52]ULO05640.1 DUF421 domain-containing protein [Paenibacillus sp. 19GGS1-52]